MRVNWILRLKNKATLTTLLVTGVAFAYSALALFGVAPSVTQEQAVNGAVSLVALLAALGIVVDPTTQGVSDSERAMGYEEPKEG